MATRTKKKSRTSFLPKPQRIPGLPALPTISSFKDDLPPISQGKQGSVVKLAPKQIQEIPAWLLGMYPLITLPEARVYLAFLKRKKFEGIDFLFQSPQLGGRTTPGGTAIDFVYLGMWPWLMLPVNGNYWHYQRGYKIVEHDLMIFRRLQQEGYKVIVLDEDDIEEQTADVVLALAIDKLQDISQLAGKI